MKTAIVICTFCLTGVFARGILINKSESETPQIRDVCLLEYGINPNEFRNNATDGLDDALEPVPKLTDEQVFCVAACVYRDYEIMRPNGTIDTNKAETYFAAEDYREREIFFAVYNACNEGKTGCNLVKCMFSELKNHWSSSLDLRKEVKSLFSSRGQFSFSN